MRSFYPLLLTPRLLGLKNRWLKTTRGTDQWTRDTLIAVFAISMMGGIYFGGKWTLEQIETKLQIAYFHPSLVLGLVLVFLFFMLLLSNTVEALGALYMGRDLDFTLSSPISQFRFFWGKYVEIIFASSWMVVIFAAPIILMFGRHYNCDISFYAHSFLIFIPYFAIPAALAMLFASVYPFILPAKYSRELLLIVGLLILYTIYSLLKMVAGEVDDVSRKG